MLDLEFLGVPNQAIKHLLPFVCRPPPQHAQLQSEWMHDILLPPRAPALLWPVAVATDGRKSHSGRIAMQVLRAKFVRGFSLVELMIAIVILGVGLLVVATMFPIAWSKARDLTESTTANTCTDNALVTVRLLTRTSQPEANPATPEIATISSFFGDATDDGAGGELPADPWVHALHMQNLIIDDTNANPPLWGDFADPTGWGATPELIGVNADLYVSLSIGLAGNPSLRPPYQIAFQDRVSPPLPNPAGLTGPSLARWRELLRQRRFCWAVLHKLNYDPAGAVPTTADGRTFTMYFVTLRRGQSTHRFARQDRVFAPDYAGGPLPIAPTPPAALLADQDALLPVPWRVEIELDSPLASPTGIPTEAYANAGPSGPTNRLVTEMMPAGAWLIDERNGLIYRVIKRDIDPANPEQAILTLDQEIPPEMLDGELLRTVWVFPPAVENRSNPGDPLQFIGPQPVVRIEARNVAFQP